MTPKRPPATVLREAIDAALFDLKVCAPATIKSVRSTDPFRVDVTVGIKSRQPDGTVLDAPVIPDVPVQFPGGSNKQAWLRMPLTAGDPGLVVFTDRCLDDWRRGTGSPQTPTSNRAHDLSDAIFIPGVMTDSGAVGWTETQAVQIKNSAMSIILHPSGKVEIKGPGAELIETLWTIWTSMLTATAGGFPFTNTADITQAVAKLLILKKV